jgi:hypothetical protein
MAGYRVARGTAVVDVHTARRSFDDTPWINRPSGRRLTVEAMATVATGAGEAANASAALR